jgi:hypothetical protein
MLGVSMDLEELTRLEVGTILNMVLDYQEKTHPQQNSR